jgi:hypothetical protein
VRYRTTYTAYLGCVHALSMVRQPPTNVLDTEERTLAELVAVRDAFRRELLTYYSSR